MNFIYIVILVLGQMSTFMCEGENKEQDEKQSMLKQHLDVVRKNKTSSFRKVQELLDADLF